MTSSRSIRTFFVAIMFLASGLIATSAQAAVTISNQSGSVVYTDLGNGLNSVYLVFQITSDAPVADAWVQLDDSGSTIIKNVGTGVHQMKFKPGVAEVPIAELGLVTGEPKGAFFQVKASALTGTNQPLTVNVYDGDPSGGPVLLASQTFNFTVEDTIQANSNKITTVVTVPVNASIGQIGKVTVTGCTGTVGSQNVVYFTPVSVDGLPAVSWLPDTFEIIDSHIIIAGYPNTPYKNVAKIPTADVAANNDDRCYTEVFSFIINDVGTAAVSPTNYVASGSSVKHTGSNPGGVFVVFIPSPSLNTVKALTGNNDPDMSGSVTQGDTLTFTITVTNTGDVALTNVVVSDPLITPTGGTTPCASVPIGGTCTLIGTHVVTLADALLGSFTNIATGDSDETPPDVDVLITPVVQAPALSIVKSATPSTYDEVGDVISYSYLVTNTGTGDLAGPVTVTDDKTTDESCPAGGLVVGAMTTCTSTYTITQADLDAGSVTNIASAHSNGTNSPTDTETVTAVQSRSLTIVKSATPSTYSAVGNVISYSYLVTNTGNVTLAGPTTVTDDKTTNESCPAGALAPGANKTCTSTYTITQADLDAGSVTNIASAHSNGIDSPTDTETVTAVPSPALSIVKSALPTTYSAVGAIINYSYVVTNTGNVTLAGPVTVTDDKTTNESCPAGGLAPGAMKTCTSSYTITQADLDSGSVTNIASAHSNGTDSATDTETVTANQSPALTIDKTPSPSTYAAVGTVISYSFLVTNTGNVTLAGPVTVTDDKTTNESCPAGGLAPGAMMTCTASYTIVQGDLDSGSVTNIASAHSNGTNSPTDTATVTAVQGPALSIVKTPSPLTYSAVGNVISYSFQVMNSGNTTLDGPFSVNDNKTTNESCPATATLVPGASITCTASHTITQADLDAGSVTNVASATNGVVTSPTDDATVTAVQSPALSIVKSATPATYSAVGNVISYSYLVTNTGNVTLAGPVTVTDDKTTNESCPAGGLAPGANKTCTSTYTIVQADLDGGSVTNIASAHSNGTDSSTDTETVTAVQTPALTIVKTATPSTYDAVGDVISYSYLVTNSGNVTLAGPVTVTDDKTINESCPAGGLAPGANKTCTSTYTIVQADLDSGSVTNIASAHSNGTDSSTDTETVTAEQNPALTIVKTATPLTYSAVGNVISYSYLVTNTGNVTLAGPVTVTDDKTTNESCPAGGLAPGANKTCTSTYTIVQADLDSGTVTNIAAAHANGTDSPTDTETVTASMRAALTIVKTATPSTYSAVGSVISYSFLVTNSGNTTLNGPFTIADDKATNESCPATATLAPGANITCTASYTITQADIDAGSVTNIASASNGTVTSPTDTETVTAIQSPALSMVKTATPNTYSAAGDLIQYSFRVTNTGNTTLTGPFTINDDKTTNESCPATATLAPGAFITCTASYTIIQSDIFATSVINIASATNGSLTSATDTETVVFVDLVPIPTASEWGLLALFALLSAAAFVKMRI